MARQSYSSLKSEMKAHEKECAMYRTMVQTLLDKLDYRVKRLEILIMGSTLSIMGVLITLFFKILNI